MSFEKHPLSAYISRLQELNTSVTAAFQPICIYGQGFYACCQYIVHLGNVMASNPTLIISPLLSNHILNFEQHLASLMRLATRCTPNTAGQLIFDETLETTFQHFLSFWSATFTVLRHVDPNSWLDLSILDAAHQQDLAFFAKGVINPDQFPERYRELLQLLSPEFNKFNVATVKIEKFLCETEFGYFCRCANATLGILKGERVDVSLFSRYISTVRSFNPNPRILLVTNASPKLPYCVAYEPIIGSLEQQLEAGVAATIRTFILLELAQALEYLHSHRIVHRSVTPGAIFITPDHHVKLGGVFTTAGDRLQLFSPFTAPELFQNPAEYTAASDVWSFSMIAWSLIANRAPFQDVPPDSFARELLQGRRPLIPQGFEEFFGRAWAAPPDRLTMSSIVKLIDSQQFVLPGTDRAAFESVRGRRPAVVERPLDIMRRNQANGPLSDADVLAVCELLNDKDPATKSGAVELLNREIQRNEPFSRALLFAVVRCTFQMPDFLPHLANQVQQVENRAGFALDLFSEASTNPTLEFLLKCAVGTDEIELMLLNFAATKGDEVAARAYDRLVAMRPDSFAHFEVVHLSAVYFERALQQVQAFPNEELLRCCNVLVPLTLAAAEKDRVMVKRLIDSLPITDAAEFDPKCHAFAKLVEWGYDNSVLRFAPQPTYFKRLRFQLFPMFRDTNHTFLLKLAMCALKQPRGGEALLRKSPILKLVVQAAQSNGCEAAGKAALKLPLAKEQFIQQIQLADTLTDCLAQVDELSDKSALLLTLVPFALKANWIPSDYVIETIAILLQTDDPVDVARALALGVVVVQRKEAAKKLSDPYNLDGVCRFLRSPEAPDHFLYTAVRFFLAIAPYLKLNEQSAPSIGDAIENIRDVALSHSGNARLVLVIAQTLAILPRLEKWDMLLRKCDVRRFTSYIRSLGGANQKMLDMVAKVDARC